MMAQGGGGSIINVSSIAGVYGSTMMSHYGTPRPPSSTSPARWAWLGAAGHTRQLHRARPSGNRGYMGVLTKQDPAAAKKAYDAVASRHGDGALGQGARDRLPVHLPRLGGLLVHDGRHHYRDGGPSAREGDEAS
jgi:hypothetical protein